MLSALFDTSTKQIALSIVDLVTALSVATALGLLLVLIYRYTHRGLHYERSFLTSLLIIPGIVAVVMMFISSNLALSLGMVGALSIIRFRTVIKDSRDMVFLFLAIAVGLGCGTLNIPASIIATVFFSLLLVALHWMQFGRAMHSDYVLVLTGEGKRPQEEVKETMERHASLAEVRSVNIRDEGWEMVYELRFFEGSATSHTEMLDELEALKGVRDVSLLAPQLALPL